MKKYSFCVCLIQILRFSCEFCWYSTFVDIESVVDVIFGGGVIGSEVIGSEVLGSEVIDCEVIDCEVLRSKSLTVSILLDILSIIF